MRWDLVRFDLTQGLPAALGVLGDELGAWDRIRAMARFAWRSATTDPFAALGPAASAAESFTRHQLRPVLLFDAVLREDLERAPEEAQEILLRLVGEIGAAFIDASVRHPSVEEWRKMSEADRAAFARGAIDRFENARGEVVEVGERSFGLDITFCHFADLARRLGRPDLAPLFCHADAVYYGRPESEIRLTRDETIAAGAERCAFRFRLDERP